MDKATHVLLIVGLTVGILAGSAVFLSKAASIDCWNFFGLTKGCSVSTK